MKRRDDSMLWFGTRTARDGAADRHAVSGVDVEVLGEYPTPTRVPESAPDCHRARLRLNDSLRSMAGHRCPCGTLVDNTFDGWLAHAIAIDHRSLAPSSIRQACIDEPRKMRRQAGDRLGGGSPARRARR